MLMQVEVYHRVCREQRPAAHQLILISLHGEAKDISVQRVALLIHWGLTPAAWLVAELGARWDRGAQSRDLQGSTGKVSTGSADIHVQLRMCFLLIQS